MAPKRTRAAASRKVSRADEADADMMAGDSAVVTQTTEAWETMSVTELRLTALLAALQGQCVPVQMLPSLWSKLSLAPLDDEMSKHVAAFEAVQKPALTEQRVQLMCQVAPIVLSCKAKEHHEDQQTFVTMVKTALEDVARSMEHEAVEAQQLCDTVEERTEKCKEQLEQLRGSLCSAVEARSAATRQLAEAEQRVGERLSADSNAEAAVEDAERCLSQTQQEIDDLTAATTAFTSMKTSELLSAKEKKAAFKLVESAAGKLELEASLRPALHEAIQLPIAERKEFDIMTLTAFKEILEAESARLTSLAEVQSASLESAKNARGEMAILLTQAQETKGECTLHLAESEALEVEADDLVTKASEELAAIEASKIELPVTRDVTKARVQVFTTAVVEGCFIPLEQLGEHEAEPAVEEPEQVQVEQVQVEQVQVEQVQVEQVQVEQVQVEPTEEAEQAEQGDQTTPAVQAEVPEDGDAEMAVFAAPVVEARAGIDEEGISSTSTAAGEVAADEADVDVESSTRGTVERDQVPSSSPTRSPSVSSPAESAPLSTGKQGSPALEEVVFASPAESSAVFDVASVPVSDSPVPVRALSGKRESESPASQLQEEVESELVASPLTENRRMSSDVHLLSASAKKARTSSGADSPLVEAPRGALLDRSNAVA